jgi:hypothetical protein
VGEEERLQRLGHMQWTIEALDCVRTRLRWYKARGLTGPEETRIAERNLVALARAAGLDVPEA